jgi:acyl-CoA thioester hydrolase
MSESCRLQDYALHAFDKLRYGDTDRQGHVNNAVYATLFETGRVELLYDSAAPVREPGSAYVIARLTIDFIREMLWPGKIDIGTRVGALGRSSVRLEQALFQDGQCVASSDSVIVLTDARTRRPRALSPASIDYLSGFQRRVARSGDAPPGPGSATTR